MRDSIFYTGCIMCMGGILLRSFFDIDVQGIALLVLIGCVAFIAQRLLCAPTGSLLFLTGLAAFSAGVGVWRMDAALRSGSVLQTYESERVMFEARVAREPEVRETRIHLQVKPIGFPETNERILVSVDRFSTGITDVRYGDELSVTGILLRPETFATDGGRTFDYPGYLRVRGIYYLVSDVEVRKTHDGTPTLMSRLFQKKHAFQAAIEDAIPEPMASLGEGVLLGVRGVLGDAREHAFRVTGIIHIVVLSGYNIMVIVEWLTSLLAFVFAPRMRMVMGIGAVSVFVLVVGASATAVRAGAMASLLLIARGFGRTYPVLRALMLAALIMLIINPHLLVHDPGFQLSFLATLGLILLSPRLETYLQAVPERFGLRAILIATIATQVFVLPLLLYQTGTFSVVALLVNMLVLPAVPLAMLFTFVAGTTGLLFAPAGLFFGLIASFPLAYILKIAEWFAAIPFASFSIEAFPFWVTLVLYMVLALFLMRSTYPRDNVKDLHDLSSWTIEEEEGEVIPASRHAS